MNTVDMNSVNKQPLVRVIPGFRFPILPKPGATLSAVLSAYCSDSPTSSKQSLTHSQHQQHPAHCQTAGAFRHLHSQLHAHHPQYSDVSLAGNRPISDVSTPLHKMTGLQFDHVAASELAFGGSRRSALKRKMADDDCFSQHQHEQFEEMEFNKLQKFNTQMDNSVYEYYPSGI
ncbi:hypothetical protein HK100_002966 [Physocladia obscura]|uniref:Uncharacterized protein n=1 Tax=Physocladia obscura TaxID=109957 RepID=A0AAD5SUL9_9FUNG|nr:hypothetical protein HK100_002966 [Physocladia obscura]